MRVCGPSCFFRERLSDRSVVGDRPLGLAHIEFAAAHQGPQAALGVPHSLAKDRRGSFPLVIPH